MEDDLNFLNLKMTSIIFKIKDILFFNKKQPEHKIIQPMKLNLKQWLWHRSV
jgi:hypothetical protein